MLRFQDSTIGVDHIASDLRVASFKTQASNDYAHDMLLLQLLFDVNVYDGSGQLLLNCNEQWPLGACQFAITSSAYFASSCKTPKPAWILPYLQLKYICKPQSGSARDNYKLVNL